MGTMYYLLILAALGAVIMTALFCDKKNWQVGKMVCYGLVFLIILFFL